jgi:RNA polymerase sigma-70 factor (ECF subfamily)
LAYFFRLLYPSLVFFGNKFLDKRATAEDIASGAFIKTWKHHARFNSPEAIRAYLYRVVRNDALKALKKEQKETALLKDVSYLWSAHLQEDHARALIASETLRQLRASLNLLPPQCGKIFRKLYLEGKTIRETAEDLHLSISTVRTQQKRGLATIRQKMASFVSLLSLLAACTSAIIGR